MTSDLIQRLTDLLQQAGAAHGVYEEETLNGVYDQQWAVWYAGWLLDNGFATLLNTALDQQNLGQLLHTLNEEHQQSGGETWAQFTARRLVERHS